MDLSIVIVNWNVRGLLKKCIESAFKETSDITFEIIVIDNNSSDGSDLMLKTLRQKYQNLHCILNKENTGFSRANNQGLKIAQGKLVLFLNPDTEIKDGALQKLVQLMRERNEIAALTCKLVNTNGTLQPNVKRHPTFLSQLLIMLKMHHLSTWCQTIEHYLARDFDYTKEAFVEQIMGAFFLTRAKIMAEIGGWDEDYWLWWEDVELCEIFAEKGWQILYTPIAEVLHHEGRSFARWNHLARQRRFNKGMAIYFKKHGVWWQVLILKLLNPVSLFLAFLAQIANLKPRTQSSLTNFLKS